MTPTPDSESSGRRDEAAQARNLAPSRIAEEILKTRLRADELATGPGDTGPWWWHGYVGAGKITLLTSQWKSGKTTLVSLLLARMLKGGELAGLDVARSRAAVFTEENRANWEARCRKLQINGQHSFFPRSFRTKPTMEQWLGLIEAMLVLRQREGLELVVIDPLGIFLPRNKENTASGMAECLLPMRELTAAGVSVLLVHHPRKGNNLAGQAARGSGALASIVDIVIEMNWYGKADRRDRRRLLSAYSRHEETLLNLVVELTAEGDDYLVHATPDEEEWDERWHALSLVLEDASKRLTQREILEQWPQDFAKPDQATISRELKRGLEQKRIRQNGSGRKNDPYRYWLPEKEDGFYPGRGASPEALERFRLYHEARAQEIFGNLAREPAREHPPGVASPPASAAPPESAAVEPASDSPVAAAPPAGAEPPTAQSAASPVAPPDAEPVQVAPRSDPVSSPAPVATPEPAPRKRSRRKGGRKAPAPPVAAQEPKPVAPAPPSGQSAAPAPQPPPVPLPAAISPAASIVPTPDPVRTIEQERIQLRMWPRIPAPPAPMLAEVPEHVPAPDVPAGAAEPPTISLPASDVALPPEPPPPAAPAPAPPSDPPRRAAPAPSAQPAVPEAELPLRLRRRWPH